MEIYTIITFHWFVNNKIDFCDLDRETEKNLQMKIAQSGILKPKGNDMSRKYKFRDPNAIYFVSFATVYWIDVFVRDVYFNEMIKVLDYCRKNKGLELYGYCIMPSHVHLLYSSKDENPAGLLRDIKHFSAKQILNLITNNIQESRREWLLWMFERAAKKSSNVKKLQLWQHNNQPIEIRSKQFFDEKLNYIHNNPIESGFVTESHYWKYSSATNYIGQAVPMLEIDLLI